MRCKRLGIIGKWTVIMIFELWKYDVPQMLHNEKILTDQRLSSYGEYSVHMQK